VARRSNRGRGAAALAPIVLILAGCGRTQNSLAPRSHQAKDIASLFWWMMGGAWIGLGLVVVLLVWSWRRRSRTSDASPPDDPKPNERRAVTVVVVLGIAVPIVVLATLFVVADIFVIKTTEAPAATATRRTVNVIGHQWWWEARYPGTAAVTANEIHIPAGVPVRLRVTSDDVIHSFWVPQLNRTIDMIPGRVNEIELDADRPGRYRGECEEFCGLQHAHMAFVVFADPPAAFRRWLADQGRPARNPNGAQAQAGLRTFLDGACQSCHTIRGTAASGTVGPDLTHVGARTTLGAATVPNRRADLARWIVDSQHLKPGNQMPDVHLSGRQLASLVAYLEGLK
jgi:cytochrome c oxidase subunit II